MLPTPVPPAGHPCSPSIIRTEVSKSEAISPRLLI